MAWVKQTTHYPTVWSKLSTHATTWVKKGFVASVVRLLTEDSNNITTEDGYLLQVEV